ncbi:MAG: heavy metal translocating P-type ATPase [Enterococcus sp.]
MKQKYHLEGIDCANCAAKIEASICKINGIKSANLDFIQGNLTVVADDALYSSEELNALTEKTIHQVEPEVTVATSKKPQDEHDHGHSNSRKTVVRILVTFIGLLGLMILQPTETLRMIGYVAIYLFIGFDVLKQAGKNILHGKVFDENFLMALATLGAMVIGEYPEAVAVMLFYQVGEYFQGYAVDQSRRSIRGLMDVRPDQARVISGDKTLLVAPEEITIGQEVLIQPGEKIPLDGVITAGISYVDTSALTGEAVPRKVIVGEQVLSGYINTKSNLTVKVTKNYGESTISKILELVENASSQKAPAEQFITRFARYYTPIVVALAVALAVIPPFIFTDTSSSEWIYRALTFLVISCPCALVISVPLSFFGGIGGASRMGVLIKGGNYLELLAQVDTMVFDKTGTLTQGVFDVQEIVTTMDTQEFLQYVASGEQYSSHPIAKSILAANQAALLPVKEVNEIAGYGIQAIIKNQHVLIGNYNLMKKEAIEATPAASAEGTIIYLAIDGTYVGYLVIADALKEDAEQAMKQLAREGVERRVMLTGDVDRVAQAVGKELGITEVHSQLLPQEKVSELENIMQTTDGKTAFVGDGMNDAPVLARADLGIAMGGLGSDAAIEAADIVIMDDAPKKIPAAIRLAKRTIRIVKQNIVFAIGVKVIVLLLGALGFATMGAAVFADVGVTVLAVLNAMRALRINK